MKAHNTVRALVALPLLLSACHEAPTSAAAQPILGGAGDATDTAVVLLWSKTLQEYCTGALIAPNLVLTAAHCVDSAITTGASCSGFPFKEATQAKQLIVSAAEEAPMYTTEYTPAAEIFAMPSPGSGTCGQDIALLVLTGPLKDAGSPLVPRVDLPAAVGDSFSAVGYGDTIGDGSGLGVRRRLDGMIVDCVEGCGLPYWKSPEWIGLADQPHIGPRPGDSGSPAIDAQGRVIGVLTRHYQAPPNGTSMDRFVYGSVSATADFLRDTAKHAAEVGGYPVPAWALGWPTDPAFSGDVGGACDASCVSGLCAGDVCTRKCNEAAPCPAGFVCNGDGLCAEETPPVVDGGTGGAGTVTSVTSGSGGSAGGSGGATGSAAPREESGGCAMGGGRGGLDGGVIAALVVGLTWRRRRRA